MQSTHSKKEAIRAYKERKPNQGVFAVRCAASGKAWVGSSPNLDAARNSIWFALGHSGSREAAMQAEWNVHGERSFSFEILEKFADDVNPLMARDLLKEKKREWAARLGAPTLL